MKREALRHPKTYDLAARLGCSRPEAIGYLNLLWDFTADVALDGDIGKQSDGVLARACDWHDSPPEFVQALVNSGWLQRDSDHRLVVVDWHRYRSEYISAKYVRDASVTYGQWVSLRRKVIRRDGMICRYCGSRITSSPHIDHVIPVAAGGTTVMGNLSVACGSCNLSKGAKSLTEWRSGTD